ncbi:PQQ-binding-like beta-propeller repeat protein [Haladaptatus sp. DYSN1]|uniref:outer membrane protein assembly factor BamB family protein n=1 Tax=unclassified Haladaptatus TaxID=2622732 RepID=UPI0024071CBD|nr:PQQ-binding-like beta-propeller repeat protein [Haladaptatus sp. DYSN1]
MPSNRRTFLATFGSAFAALSGCLSLDSSEAEGTWPRSTIDNSHTGHTGIEGPASALHTEWKQRRDQGGVVITSPVVGDSTVYFGFSQEPRTENPGGAWLEALDATTGESRWVTELWRSDEFYYFYLADSLVLHDDRIYVQTKPGLKALDLDGTVQWTFDNLFEPQQRPDVVPPIVTDDVVVAGTYGSPFRDQGQVEAVYGIDPADGSERWKTTFPEETLMWQLSATDGIVYVPMIADDLLIALDMETGEELWREQLLIDGAPTIVDDTLFVALSERTKDGKEYVVALDRETRETKWKQEITPRWTDAGFAVADGLLYHAAGFGLDARNVKTGERSWRFGRPENVSVEAHEGNPEIDLVSTPVVSGGSVYVPGWLQRDTVFGQVFVLDAKTGEEQARAKLGRNSQLHAARPAVASDLVFAPTNHGELFAFGTCNLVVLGHCLVD